MSLFLEQYVTEYNTSHQTSSNLDEASFYNSLLEINETLNLITETMYINDYTMLVENRILNEGKIADFFKSIIERIKELARNFFATLTGNPVPKKVTSQVFDVVKKHASQLLSIEGALNTMVATGISGIFSAPAETRDGEEGKGRIQNFIDGAKTNIEEKLYKMTDEISEVVSQSSAGTMMEVPASFLGTLIRNIKNFQNAVGHVEKLTNDLNKWASILDENNMLVKALKFGIHLVLVGLKYIKKLKCSVTKCTSSAEGDSNSNSSTANSDSNKTDQDKQHSNSNSSTTNSDSNKTDQGKSK